MVKSEQARSGSVWVELPGPRFDAAVANTVKSELRGLVDQGVRRLEIDFSQVEFMDSSGLGALVGSLKLMGPGGQIAINNPRSAVVKVLKLTRMNKVFVVRNAPDC